MRRSPFSDPYDLPLGHPDHDRKLAEKRYIEHRLRVERDRLKKELEGDDPPIPQPPPWDPVFDWYYRHGKAQGMNLKELAKRIHRSYGTVRNRHSEYKDQHGEGPLSPEK